VLARARLLAGALGRLLALALLGGLLGSLLATLALALALVLAATLALAATTGTTLLGEFDELVNRGDHSFYNI
tara:strand:- start:394 stop:612 length:219 start_codon:yes stop_codon:yes gene_type:complete